MRSISFRASSKGQALETRAASTHSAGKFAHNVALIRWRKSGKCGGADLSGRVPRNQRLAHCALASTRLSGSPIRGCALRAARHSIRREDPEVIHAISHTARHRPLRPLSGQRSGRRQPLPCGNDCLRLQGMGVGLQAGGDGAGHLAGHRRRRAGRRQIQHRDDQARPQPEVSSSRASRNSPAA